MDETVKPDLPPGLTQEALDALKAKHGEVMQLKSGQESIVVRQPSPGEWERFQGRIDEDPKSQYRALNEMLSACTVYPDATGLNSLLRKHPAWVKKLGMGLVMFAAGEDALEKNVL